MQSSTDSDDEPAAASSSTSTGSAAAAAASAAAHSKSAKKQKQKRDLRHRGPLPVSARLQQSSAPLTDLQQLQRCQDMYNKLPKQSAYARHKLLTLQKAISILELKRWVH